MRGLQSGVLKYVFCVTNMNGIFKDAIHAYYANAGAMSAVVPKRKGQICYGVSGSTRKAYIAHHTDAGDWTDISA